MFLKTGVYDYYLLELVMHSKDEKSHCYSNVYIQHKNAVTPTVTEEIIDIIEPINNNIRFIPA